MSDLQKKYEAWLAKTSDKNYGGRNVTEEKAAQYQTAGAKLKAAQANNPDWKRNNSESSKRLAKDPVWLTKMDKLNKMRARPVTTPYGEFESIIAYKDVVKRGFHDLHKALPHLYYYTEDGPGEVKTEKTLNTIYGSCANAGGDPGSIRIMFQIAKDAGCERAIKMKDSLYWFKKMCKIDPENFYTQVEPKRDWNLKK
jgi:hypothetical protein